MTFDEVNDSTARRRKLYMQARQIGLTRQDRLDLAEYVLRRDIASWQDLDDQQVIRLLDAVEGYLLIGFLLGQQVPHSGVA